VAAVALLLLGLLGVVVLGSGSSAPAASPAPRRCLELWNHSTRALVYGYHNFHSHGYREAEVMYLDRVGVASRRGRCAVVFPAAELDREQASTVKVFQAGRWRPLSATDRISAVRLSELQVEAEKGANVLLRADGTLAPFL
jgi:hypothetical protein